MSKYMRIRPGSISGLREEPAALGGGAACVEVDGRPELPPLGDQLRTSSLRWPEAAQCFHPFTQRCVCVEVFRNKEHLNIFLIVNFFLCVCAFVCAWTCVCGTLSVSFFSPLKQITFKNMTHKVLPAFCVVTLSFVTYRI